MIIWYRLSPWCCEAIVNGASCRVWLDSDGIRWKSSVEGDVLGAYNNHTVARRATALFVTKVLIRGNNE